MLLVSCCGEGGGLFLINEETFHIEKVFPYDCTGIAQLPNKDIIAFSHSLRSLLRFNKNFVLKQYQVLGNDFHGVFYADGSLYATDTYHDKIYKYDLETLQGIYCWDFSSLSIDTENDLFHINDIWVRGELMFISMFCDKSPTEEQRFNSFIPGNPGRVYIKNILDTSNLFGNLLLGELLQPHSPVVFPVLRGKDEFYICNSKESSIIKGSLVVEDGILKLPHKEEIKLSGFTRGLYVTRGCIYVGISSSIKRTVEEFKDVVCGISLLDKKTCKQVQFIPLPANEVYNIIPINN